MIYGKPMPQVAIASEHYFQMRRLITEGTPVTVELNIQNQWDEHNLKGYNVVAEMQGTDPLLKTEVVMLDGHLDSWHTGTGATDNGAGCIVMMEAVRILKSLGVKPRRTIRIALWGGEEQGELGSASYVRTHFVDASGATLPEQSKISVYFNLDNGTGKIRGIYLQNNHAADKIFKNWLAPFADLGATGLTESNTGATDHIEFDTAGIPGFQFIQDPLEYEQKTHHSNMDVYDHLAFDDLRQAAIVVAGFIYNVAMRDDMIPRKPTLK